MPRQHKFASWSWSRYQDYKLCPLKAKLAHLDKIREPKNDAMARGALIHDQARDYIKGVIRTLPLALAKVKGHMAHYKKEFKKRLLGAIIEDDWAFTAEWTQTQWNDWAGCALRVKLDAAHYEDEETLVVTDWKTGKFHERLNEEYLEQLELYGLAALVLLPHVKRVKPRLVYTDINVVYPPLSQPIVFERSEVPRLKKLWAKRIKPMMNDAIFAPRPNDKCSWCFYGQSGKARGGPGLCKY